MDVFVRVSGRCELFSLFGDRIRVFLVHLRLADSSREG
jgi:hypothetical protein